MYSNTNRNNQPRSMDAAFHIHANTDMVRPNTHIIICETNMSCFGVALGWIYALYTSKVRREDTAISSADAQEVTAMNNTISNATAPPLPISVSAANAAARPDDICPEVGTSGYVGKRGLSVSAAAASPNVVEKPKGIANHARPPSRYARTAVEGFEAMARCQ
jgi:hypothetical protein